MGGTYTRKCQPADSLSLSGTPSPFCWIPQDRLWTGSFDSQICVWDAAGQCVQRCVGHRSWVYCLTAVGDKVWSGSVDGSIRIWDAAGQCVNFMKTHIDAVNALLVWDEHVFSASGDATISVWSEDGELLRRCRGHKDAVLYSCPPTHRFVFQGSSPSHPPLLPFVQIGVRGASRRLARQCVSRRRRVDT